MKVDFDEIEETVIPNFKGGEKFVSARIFSDGLNKLMKIKLCPGASIGEHTHTTNSEIIFITKGKCHVVFDGETIELEEGDVHYCPKGHTHCLINDSDCEVSVNTVVAEQ